MNIQQYTGKQQQQQCFRANNTKTIIAPWILTHSSPVQRYDVVYDVLYSMHRVINMNNNSFFVIIVTAMVKLGQWQDNDEKKRREEREWRMMMMMHKEN